MNDHTNSKELKARFFALPNSPHLTHTFCGYTLMTLAGFSGCITSDQIEMVTINGEQQEFKPLGDNTIAVIPAFKQEAQVVKVYCNNWLRGQHETGHTNSAHHRTLGGSLAHTKTRTRRFEFGPGHHL